jgi:hypothetical protein
MMFTVLRPDARKLSMTFPTKFLFGLYPSVCGKATLFRKPLETSAATPPISP